jgi:gliding motility-associated-like protein
MNRSGRLFFSVYITALLTGIHFYAGCQYLHNPSFEGTGGVNLPPGYWIPCHSKYSTPYLQPNNVDILLEPSDGEHYMSMQVRGSYPEDYKGSRETVYTQLIQPLLKDKCYQFSVDLAYDEEVDYFGTLTKVYPVKFKVWGSTALCEKFELLYETEEVIDNLAWKTFTTTIAPRDSSYSYLYIEPDHANDSIYPGILLIDNMVLTDSITHVTTTDIEVWPGTDVTLQPSVSNSYQWSQTPGLSCYTCANPVLTANTEETYVVSLKDEKGCPRLEAFRIGLLSCETVYPEPSRIVLDTLVAENTTLTLLADSGLSYNWYPADLVSCPTCREITIDVTNTIDLEVTIGEEHGCNLTNQFRVRMELIYPNVITPNGDGTNDIFAVRGLPPISKFQVFSRNGMLVYSSNNYQNNWSGEDIYKSDLPEDTYWFTLQNDRYQVNESGFILVKR